jgi:pectate lyase
VLDGKGFVTGGSDDVILTHLTILDVQPTSEDGVQIGNALDPAERIVLDHLTFVQSGADGSTGSSSVVDEAVSVVFGARDITIQHCRFDSWEKALLFGNGDVGADVDGAMTVTVVRSVFLGTGRRHPQARHGVFDVVNNLLFDWRFFESPYAEPYPECFGAQIQDDGRMRFEGNIVSRGLHAYDDAPFVSQAHDVTRCETAGVLDERGTFIRGDNTDPGLAFGVGCTAATVARPYPLAVAVANEALAVELLATAGNVP